jgi:Family of unknown function (DUF5709)
MSELDAGGYVARMTEIPPSEVPEESEQLDQTPEGDRLDPRGPEDVLDEGYSPPERWSPAQKYGNTHLEEELGETLDQRLAEEEPDPFERSLDIGAGEGDDDDDEGPELQEPTGEIGDVRAGRLALDEEGGSDVFADDVGIDGAGAGAEEAAVHVVADDDLLDDEDVRVTGDIGEDR